MSKFKPVRITQEMIDEYLKKGYWTEEVLCDFLPLSCPKD